MYRSKRPNPLAQHFLHNRQLVHTLVRKSDIGPQDTVIEIGPGRGIITQELLRTTHHVIAVELDQYLT